MQAAAGKAALATDTKNKQLKSYEKQVFIYCNNCCFSIFAIGLQNRATKKQQPKPIAG